MAGGNPTRGLKLVHHNVPPGPGIVLMCAGDVPAAERVRAKNFQAIERFLKECASTTPVMLMALVATVSGEPRGRKPTLPSKQFKTGLRRKPDCFLIATTKGTMNKQRNPKQERRIGAGCGISCSPCMAPAWATGMTRADCGPVVIMCLGTMYGHVGMRWHVDALRLMWPRLRARAVEVAELPDAVLDLESCDTVAALGPSTRVLVTNRCCPHRSWEVRYPDSH